MRTRHLFSASLLLVLLGRCVCTAEPAPGEAGDSCDEAAPCAEGLECVDGTCLAPSADAGRSDAAVADSAAADLVGTDTSALPDSTTQPDGAAVPDGATAPDSATTPDGATLTDGPPRPDGWSWPDGWSLPDGMSRPDGWSLPDGVSWPDVQWQRDGQSRPDVQWQRDGWEWPDGFSWPDGMSRPDLVGFEFSVQWDGPLPDISGMDLVFDAGLGSYTGVEEPGVVCGQGDDGGQNVCDPAQTCCINAGLPLLSCNPDPYSCGVSSIRCDGPEDCGGPRVCCHESGDTFCEFARDCSGQVICVDDGDCSNQQVCCTASSMTQLGLDFGWCADAC